MGSRGNHTLAACWDFVVRCVKVECEREIFVVAATFVGGEVYLLGTIAGAGKVHPPSTVEEL
jgi:hypothetical protein